MELKNASGMIQSTENKKWVISRVEKNIHPMIFSIEKSVRPVTLSIKRNIFPVIHNIEMRKVSAA